MIFKANKMVIRKFCDVQELEIALEHPIQELSKEEISTLQEERYAEYLGMIEFQMQLELSAIPPKVIIEDYTLELLDGIRFFYIRNDIWAKKLLYYSRIESGKFQFHFSAQVKDLPCLHTD